jgi:uncharacterized protein YcbK (DUF882 family)
MIQLTENFTQEEFSCKCGCGYSNVDVGLVHRLQVVRDIVGSKIQILSGCRCPSHNQAVGGKPNSYHLKGMAADWTLEGGNGLLEKCATKLIQNWSGGFHYYPEQHFVHADVGPRRRW